MTRSRLGGQMWGYHAGRPADLAVLRGRQPGAGRPPRPPRSPPSPGAPGCRAAAARRSWGRRRPSWALWELLRPYWGQPREIRASPAGHGHLRPAAGGARPAGAPGPARASSSILLPASVAMFTEEVGVSPVGPGRRRRLPGPGGRADRLGPRVRPDRGRPGGVQGRDRRGHPARLPGPGGLGAARAARPRAGRGRDGRGGQPRRCATSRPWCRCTSTTSTPRPGPPTGGSASPRSPPSRPCCSEPAPARRPIG